MDQFGKTLKDDERIIQTVHQHLIIFGWPFVISCALFLVPFFLLYPLFGLGQGGIAIFIFMTVFGLGLGVRTFIIWRDNFTLLTDQRIIFFSKQQLFSKKIFGVELELVDDVVVHTRGVLASAFDYNDIKLVIIRKDSTKKKWLKCIPDGQSFAERILEYAKIAIEKKEPVFYTAEDVIDKTPVDELFKAMRQIRDKLGDERFIESLKPKD